MPGVIMYVSLLDPMDSQSWLLMMQTILTCPFVQRDEARMNYKLILFFIFE